MSLQNLLAGTVRKLLATLLKKAKIHLSVTIQYERCTDIFHVFSIYVSVCVYPCSSYCIHTDTSTHLSIRNSHVKRYSLPLSLCVLNANEMYTGCCPFDLSAHTIYPPHGNRDGDSGAAYDCEQLANMYAWWCCCCCWWCCGCFFFVFSLGDSNQHNHESAMYLRRPFFPFIECAFSVVVILFLLWCRCAIESQKVELNFISFRRTLVCFDCCNIKLVAHRIRSSFRKEKKFFF